MASSHELVDESCRDAERCNARDEHGSRGAIFDGFDRRVLLGMQMVGEASTGKEAVQKYKELHPDVVLMDLRMPEMTGIDATREIRKDDPEAKIIALTSYDGDQDIYRAIEAGVRGYILKEMVHTKVLDAIRTVQAGSVIVGGISYSSDPIPRVVGELPISWAGAFED